MTEIDPRAEVHPSAEIADDVRVGPWTVIGPQVQIGAGSEIGAHVVIKQHTRMGRNNRILQFASLGEDPQDLKYEGEETWLEMGDGNTVREYATINRGTGDGGGVTRIGNNNFFMAYIHVAHDCQVADNTILANNTTLAGHVEVARNVILGGHSAVHQFCRLGEFSFIGHGGALVRDVPPYVMVSEYPIKPRGINRVGLARNGFSSEEIDQVRKAYKVLYRSGLRLEEAWEQLSEMAKTAPKIQPMADFIKDSKRSILR